MFTLNIPPLDVFAAGKERAHVLCQRGAEELASQIRPALNLIIINKKYKIIRRETNTVTLSLSLFLITAENEKERSD